jgi:hypothetical protein
MFPITNLINTTDMSEVMNNFAQYRKTPIELKSV